MSIEINKLQLGYQDKTIVRDLSLTFPSNQIIALIGPNGCGKSTTLKAVARLLKPRLGTITHKGKDIWQSTPKEYAKQLAFLPQQHLVPEGIKVRELIAYGRSPYLNLWGKLSDKDEQLVAWAMEQTHTTELAEHLVSDLSGGQQQRVFLSWTGYTWEEMMLETPDKLEFLSLIDILVDGRYDKSKRNLMLQFRGSSNQRIIDVQKSLKSGQVVIWDKLNDGKESYEQVKRE